MKKIFKKYFPTNIVILSLLFFLYIPNLQAIDLDLTTAQDAVGKRFANKFCEAKEKDVSSETASEFALNNTYLKFVYFPDDEKFIENLWEFTIVRIRQDCGDYVTQNEEDYLRDFFEEEGKIASNRDLYLPN